MMMRDRPSQVVGMLSVLLRSEVLEGGPAVTGLMLLVDELFCDLARVTTEISSSEVSLSFTRSPVESGPTFSVFVNRFPIQQRFGPTYLLANPTTHW